MAKLHDTSSSTKSTDGNSYISARVVDIILDVNHKRAKEFGGYDAIGTIFYSLINLPQKNPNTQILNSAKPLFTFIKQYPLKNEIVLLVNAPQKNFLFSDLEGSRNATQKYYLPNVNIWNHQHQNALPEMSVFLEKEDKNDNTNYETTGTNVVRTAETDNSVEVPLGEYFNENLSIQPLLPFEGDTIVEGRFGNSIRLGATAKEAPDKTAYSTKGETGDPITIIRNGQHVEESDNGWEHTIENINSDHSTIYLTSNQVLPNMEIVSLHWQSWMAKHDDLEVKGENEFDNITKGIELEAIEPEKPEETADQELEEATEEDIATEENENEDPEDCLDCGDTIPEDGEAEGGWDGRYLKDGAVPGVQGGDLPVDTPTEIIVDTGFGTMTNQEPPITSENTQDAIPEDIEWYLEDYGEHKGYTYQRGYSRTDGDERIGFYIKDPETPPIAGSIEEYVYEEGRDGNYESDIIEAIDDTIKQYEDGDRIWDGTY